MTMKTRREDVIGSSETRYFSFGVCDPKGREIGVKVTTWEVHFIEDTTLESWYDREPGRYFAFEPHATRNQQYYGAMQSFRCFTSTEERRHAIEAYVNAARKRAQKVQ
jgi:hypothetical protein